jgi:serine/threonine-protein kinase RsbW
MRTQATLPATPSSVPAPDPPAVLAWEGTYPGAATSARLVRAAVRRVLAGCPAADDVVLAVTELAANAIAHSASGRPGGTFAAREQAGRGHVRAEVRDQGSGWDGDLAAAARHPHGLWLVTALSSACGTSPAPGGGRLVWACIDDPPPQAGGCDGGAG